MIDPTTIKVNDTITFILKVDRLIEDKYTLKSELNMGFQLARSAPDKTEYPAFASTSLRLFLSYF